MECFRYKSSGNPHLVELRFPPACKKLQKKLFVISAIYNFTALIL